MRKYETYFRESYLIFTRHGIEIENCSNVVATKNLSYNNVAGILVVLLPGLTTKSSSQITISHNYVYNNNHINFAEAGGGFEAFVPSGSGILVVGTDQTTVEHNIVAGNNFVGIATERRPHRVADNSTTRPACRRLR